MTTGALDDELVSFIGRFLSSLEQLEVLLLLQRHAGREWTVQQVAAELRTSEMAAQQALDHLARHRLISSGQFQYSPTNPEHDRIVRTLVGVYRERRVAVINQIFAGPSDPLRDFANAFVLGGKGRKDG